MIANLVILAVLVVLAVVFAWLVRRAWGSHHRILKWPALILSGLVTLVLALVVVVAGIGLYKLSVAPYSYPAPANLQVSRAPALTERGEKLANICAGCHSTANQPPLDGSAVDFGAESGLPIGHLQPPNLTPAGPLSTWTDDQIMRAIREGVDKDGRPLLIMPSEQFHGMSDADLQSLVAFLRSQPPVQHDIAPTSPSILAALFIGSGAFPTSAQPPITQPVVAPPTGVTPEYGQYLVEISGCRGCHGENLTGGTPGNGPPPGPNIRAAVPQWTEADFVKTIRTGVDPTGHALNPDEMPWKNFSAAYSDDELKAIYTYIRSLR